ncbi:MFS transporter [Rhodococcus sp. IEGM 1379]|uniref:MFS transporter n=1 Tax=Rhodococcus sp. IEGM 1379 TaxID=3047086 RepID=UPI0024B73174|nr:MFS transporter [Rhodococcus sp. IEGM 1379]MDI9913983.1 MFS transporter [Rhodococcus sp. IEGM 1379]
MIKVTPDGTVGRRFWLLFAASTLCCLASGAATPALPQFFEHELGRSAAVVGAVIAVASLIAMISHPALGYIADRRGRRPLALCGSLIATFGVVSFLWSGDILTVGTGRIFLGLGLAACNIALTAWVVDSTRLDQRGRAVGIFGVSVWLGLAGGPQIGQILLHTWGFDSVWIGAGALTALALICVCCTPRTPTPTRPPKGSAGWINTAILVRRPAAVAALAWAGEGILLTFLLLHLENQGLGSTGFRSAAMIFTVFAASVVVSRLALGRVVDRVRTDLVCAAGMLTVAIGFAVTIFADNFAAAAAAAVILGCGFSPLYPALIMLATTNLDRTRRAVGLGIFTASVEAGVAGGVLIGGLLAARYGVSAALWAALGAQLIGAVLATGTNRPPSQESLRKPAGPRQTARVIAQ